MSLVNYEPMKFFNRLEKELNNFYRLNNGRGLRQLFKEPETWLAGEWIPTLDIEETEKQFVITVDLPGVDSKDVQVSMANGVLCIKGERRSEHEEKKKNYHVKEVSYGSFERHFAMPDTADGDKVQAKNKNGVLKVTVDKKPAAKSRLIEIES